jgi:3'-phosphoadenosine 5'-phosphosulfate sulfotransferase (PAPS reductase)/FAD synthetase
MDASFDIPFEWIESNTPVTGVFNSTDYVSEMHEQAYSLFWLAVSDIKAIRKHYITICATSFAKDSTVTLLAALQAHKELIEEGVLDSQSPFVATHIDTGVENHLFQMLSRHERDRITAYCANNNINLDLRIGHPPLSKQWAALYCSGIKLISSARSNNDCSVILKRDNAALIEKAVEEKYGSDTVTLLGTRMDESIARKHKMKRGGSDKRTALNIIDKTDKGEMVFAPIKTMTDADVWTLIRCAGTSPITQPDNRDAIPSYAPNHRLLHVIYSDSKDGSCPTTAKRVKGQKDGGCGGSARSGCYVCAKVIIDKSGEQQAKQIRHSVISKNILSVRNYIMYVAQDIDYRTYQSRAVHQPTGAVALQPNALNSETINRLVWLLTQASWDDATRAKQFRLLVKNGRELEDEGYQDIINDETLDPRDKAVLAEVYLKYAQENLIQPMTLELAVYLSAIHSRDGVRLPPYRAIHIWDRVSKGERIEYPDVDPTKGKVSDIPDAIMITPSKGITIPPVPTLSSLDHEGAGGCNADEVYASTTMPTAYAKHFLPEGEIHDGKVNVNGLYAHDAGLMLKDKPSTKKVIRHKASKRAIKKVSTKGGQYKVLQRGRTSLDSPSFGHRTSVADFTSRHLESIPVYTYDNTSTFDLMVEANDEQITGYDINIEHLHDWDQFGGAQSALDEHDRFVEQHLKHDGYIFFYGGTEAFMSLERYGVLRFNSRAKKHTLRILQRTAYFNALGLLSIDDKALVKLANSDNTQPDVSLSSFRRNIKCNITLGIDKVFNMAQFRHYFACELVSLRKERNANRAEAKALVNVASSDPVLALRTMLENTWNKFKPVYALSASKQAYAKTLIKENCYGFDGEDYRLWLKLTDGNMKYMEHYFSSEEGQLSLLPNNARKAIANDAAKLAPVKLLAKAIIREMDSIRETAHLNRLGVKEDYLVEQETLESISDIKKQCNGIKLGQKVVNATIEW